jgi:hypothetical protein
MMIHLSGVSTDALSLHAFCASIFLLEARGVKRDMLEGDTILIGLF